MAVIKLQGRAPTGVLIKQPGEKTVYKRNGIIERSTIYMSFGYPTNPPVPLSTPYPDQSTGGFIADQVTIEEIEGGWFRTTTLYVSIVGQGTSYITFESKTIQAPIEQSPIFLTQIGGTFDHPLNNALFDGNHKFIGFASPSKFLGVVTYFAKQELEIVRGSSSNGINLVDDGTVFIESKTVTIRGGVVEYEIVYNLSIKPDGNPIQVAPL